MAGIRIISWWYAILNIASIKNWAAKKFEKKNGEKKFKNLYIISGKVKNQMKVLIFPQF